MRPDEHRLRPAALVTADDQIAARRQPVHRAADRDAEMKAAGTAEILNCGRKPGLST
jgi:hypothetical protein